MCLLLCVVGITIMSLSLNQNLARMVIAVVKVYGAKWYHSN
jgi:hypothetical protein